MSIFNQLTYYVLVGELALFLILLIPFTFIPIRARKSAMNWIHKVLTNETVVWISRIVFLLVGGVFVDTLMRMQKLDTELHRRDDEDGHFHHGTPLEELQFKSKLFYSQRNMYLSLMSLFMTIVIYRRVKDLYLILHLEDMTDSDKTTIKNLKTQVEVMVKAMPETKASSEKKTASTTTATPAATETKIGEKLKESEKEDPTEAAGMRKRK
ncbi:hypothetical protein HDU98_010018 [Podochytrium sp. JEL0797]|nr:hypothetical protein HDU98_010018 [Podochytrium sp. JEL0797]